MKRNGQSSCDVTLVKKIKLKLYFKFDNKLKDDLTVPKDFFI